MSDPDHLERFVAIKSSLQGHGRQVVAYALVVVDDQGEVYWGADYGGQGPAGLMLTKLAQIKAGCKGIATGEVA